MSLHAVQPVAQSRDGVRQLQQQVRRPSADWMTVAEITHELRFPTCRACRAWLRREGIASVRRGRVILVSRRDIDARLRAVR